MSQDDYAQHLIQSEIARNQIREGLEPVEIPKFLTTDDRVLSVFYEVSKNEQDQDILVLPPEKKILHTTMLLLNSHLTRTGNMTTNEAELFRRKVKRIFLMLEAEQSEDSYEGDLWALYEDIVLHLEGAVRDNIGGWRGKLLTVKEWYAHLSTTGEGKGLRGLFGRK